MTHGSIVADSRSAESTVAPVEELRALEAEAVHIIREVVAELERPVLLFSAGKDSIVLLRLAEKAFRPSPVPFPVLHVDTGHNFPEVLEFRDRRLAECSVSATSSANGTRVRSAPSRGRSTTGEFAGANRCACFR